ncbi:LOW QUALITY PROTEIN: hypothetical protein BU14_0134s0011 [Porphyra umbilicalis]|uniref:ATP-dependent RNA helicase n=1 Tax=Porphyra umbilicalis TaxID=2786 RepID=A0A1X6PA54_PORUM|nr:LOW QUALITY PROTEIN: hypothetical protein BU14_0134s0011 [Porphyra umbilicalis]|eukprot:OSX77789.1 LOW QUALITY PROTEIN: hypothetical protein BU14_0134s0011 [Porphyra umbilicalis]
MKRRPSLEVQSVGKKLKWCWVLVSGCSASVDALRWRLGCTEKRPSNAASDGRCSPMHARCMLDAISCRADDDASPNGEDQSTPHFCPGHGLVVAATTVAAAPAACGMVTLGGMRWRLARRPPPPLPTAGERRTDGPDNDGSTPLYLASGALPVCTRSTMAPSSLKSKKTSLSPFLLSKRSVRGREARKKWTACRGRRVGQADENAAAWVVPAGQTRFRHLQRGCREGDGARVPPPPIAKRRAPLRDDAGPRPVPRRARARRPPAVSILRCGGVGPALPLTATGILVCTPRGCRSRAGAPQPKRRTVGGSASVPDRDSRRGGTQPAPTPTLLSRIRWAPRVRRQRSCRPRVWPRQRQRCPHPRQAPPPRLFPTCARTMFPSRRSAAYRAASPPPPNSAVYNVAVAARRAPIPGPLRTPSTRGGGAPARAAPVPGPSRNPPSRAAATPTRMAPAPGPLRTPSSRAAGAPARAAPAPGALRTPSSRAAAAAPARAAPAPGLLRTPSTRAAAAAAARVAPVPAPLRTPPSRATAAAGRPTSVPAPLRTPPARPAAAAAAAAAAAPGRPKPALPYTGSSRRRATHPPPAADAPPMPRSAGGGVRPTPTGAAPDTWAPPAPTPVPAASSRGVHRPGLRLPATCGLGLRPKGARRSSTETDRGSDAFAGGPASHDGDAIFWQAAPSGAGSVEDGSERGDDGGLTATATTAAPSEGMSDAERAWLRSEIDSLPSVSSGRGSSLGGPDVWYAGANVDAQVGGGGSGRDRRRRHTEGAAAAAAAAEEGGCLSGSPALGGHHSTSSRSWRVSTDSNLSRGPSFEQARPKAISIPLDVRAAKAWAAAAAAGWLPPACGLAAQDNGAAEADDEGAGEPVSRASRTSATPWDSLRLHFGTRNGHGGDAAAAAEARGGAARRYGGGVGGGGGGSGGGGGVDGGGVDGGGVGARNDDADIFGERKLRVEPPHLRLRRMATATPSRATPRTSVDVTRAVEEVESLIDLEEWVPPPAWPDEPPLLSAPPPTVPSAAAAAAALAAAAGAGDPPSPAWSVVTGSGRSGSLGWAGSAGAGGGQHAASTKAPAVADAPPKTRLVAGGNTVGLALQRVGRTRSTSLPLRAAAAASSAAAAVAGARRRGRFGPPPPAAAAAADSTPPDSTPGSSPPPSPAASAASLPWPEAADDEIAPVRAAPRAGRPGGRSPVAAAAVAAAASALAPPPQVVRDYYGPPSSSSRPPAQRETPLYRSLRPPPPPRPPTHAAGILLLRSRVLHAWRRRRAAVVGHAVYGPVLCLFALPPGVGPEPGRGGGARGGGGALGGDKSPAGRPTMLVLADAAVTRRDGAPIDGGGFVVATPTRTYTLGGSTGSPPSARRRRSGRGPTPREGADGEWHTCASHNGSSRCGRHGVVACKRTAGTRASRVMQRGCVVIAWTMREGAMRSLIVTQKTQKKEKSMDMVARARGRQHASPWLHGQPHRVDGDPPTTHQRPNNKRRVLTDDGGPPTPPTHGNQQSGAGAPLAAGGNAKKKSGMPPTLPHHPPPPPPSACRAAAGGGRRRHTPRRRRPPPRPRTAHRGGEPPAGAPPPPPADHGARGDNGRGGAATVPAVPDAVAGGGTAKNVRLSVNVLVASAHAVVTPPGVVSMGRLGILNATVSYGSAAKRSGAAGTDPPPAPPPAPPHPPVPPPAPPAARGWSDAAAPPCAPSTPRPLRGGRGTACTRRSRGGCGGSTGPAASRPCLASARGGATAAQRWWQRRRRRRRRRFCRPSRRGQPWLGGGGGGRGGGERGRKGASPARGGGCTRHAGAAAAGGGDGERAGRDRVERWGVAVEGGGTGNARVKSNEGCQATRPRPRGRRAAPPRGGRGDDGGRGTSASRVGHVVGDAHKFGTSWNIKNGEKGPPLPKVSVQHGRRRRHRALIGRTLGFPTVVAGASRPPSRLCRLLHRSNRHPQWPCLAAHRASRRWPSLRLSPTSRAPPRPSAAAASHGAAAMATAGPWTALAAAGVPAALLDPLPALGYPTMTPVQAAAIPPILARKDVCVQAETGSGKTLSFLLPAAVAAVGASTGSGGGDGGSGDGGSGGGGAAGAPPPVTVLIIEPTRELARQVHAVATTLFAALPGGVTPAALAGGEVAAGGLQLLILDEADRLLDMGFRVTLTAILSRLPRQRRTGLYSATQTVALDELAAAGLRNPVRVVVRVREGVVAAGGAADAGAGGGGSPAVPTATAAVGAAARSRAAGGGDGAASAAAAAAASAATAAAGSSRLPASLRCYYGVFKPEEKLPALLQLLAAKPREKAIVYLLTCAEVDWYARLDWAGLLGLAGGGGGGGSRGGAGAAAGAADGDPPPPPPAPSTPSTMTQKKRVRALAAFTAAAGGILLATDVAARGLDVPHVATVVQVSPPQSPESYIHRVGRSARLGRPGEAVLLLLPSEDTYVDYLAVRSTPAAALPPAYAAVPPAVAAAVAAAIRAATLADRAVMEAGEGAFLSYLRAYKEHRCGYILRMDTLDIAGVARGHGCLRMPRVAEFAKHRAAVAAFVREPGLDLRAVPYAEARREAARRARAAAAAAAGPPPRRPRTPRAKEVQKKERKRRKREGAAARLLGVAAAAAATAAATGGGGGGRGGGDDDDDAELEREVRLLRKVKRGKLSERDFDRSAGQRVRYIRTTARWPWTRKQSTASRTTSIKEAVRRETGKQDQKQKCVRGRRSAAPSRGGWAAAYGARLLRPSPPPRKRVAPRRTGPAGSRPKRQSGVESVLGRAARRYRHGCLPLAGSPPPSASPSPPPPPPRLVLCSAHMRAYTPPSTASSCACVPRSTTRPRSITKISSACATVERRCATITVVRPDATRRSADCIASSVSESSDEDDSSSSSSAGDRRTTRAMPTRCRSPPDRRRPRSPTSVSRPAGAAATKASSCATRTAAAMSASGTAARAARGSSSPAAAPSSPADAGAGAVPDAPAHPPPPAGASANPSRPYAKLNRSVSLRSTVSWETTPTARRSDACVTCAIRWPSTVMRPPSTS